MSLARVLARLRSGRGRAYVLSAPFALLALVPLAHAGPPDAMWIPGIYDACDLDDVVWTLISTGTVVVPTRLTGTAGQTPHQSSTSEGQCHAPH